MFIPDPDPRFLFYLPILDPGSRCQKGTGSRIRIRNTRCNIPYFCLISKWMHIMQGKLEEEETVKKQLQPPPIKPVMPPPGISLFTNRGQCVWDGRIPIEMGIWYRTNTYLHNCASKLTKKLSFNRNFSIFFNLPDSNDLYCRNPNFFLKTFTRIHLHTTVVWKKIVIFKTDVNLSIG
jgi:hypothetical protein